MQTSNAVPKCQYCGSAYVHQGVCPTVRAIEYYPDGTVKRVELKTAADYPPIKDSGGLCPNCGAQTAIDKIGRCTNCGQQRRNA